ncbi:hypothetical protein BH23BAC4_BH23BAC4_09410 [soil metagenome]
MDQKRSRRFVIIFVATALLLALAATVMIYRGWKNPVITDHIEQREARERQPPSAP